MDVGVITNTHLSEVSFYGGEKLVVGLYLAFRGITIAINLNGTVDLRAEK